VVHQLAARGTQLILLVRDRTDVFTVDYIEDLRSRYDNPLIYAEECDLSSLHSIRLFATKFIDNTPPRRLDMVICCAGLMAPPYTLRTMTKDGIEAHWGLNFLANFHLLNILAPALRAQPPDRDVRVMLATCSSHVAGDLNLEDVQFISRGYPSSSPWLCYGASKMALMAFCVEFQRRLDAYVRSDKQPNNVRCYNIDPGFVRTPGARRWLSLGGLWGLGLYLVMWPFWWLVLKDPQQGAQTFLAAAMSPECGMGEGGKFLRECQNQKYGNPFLSPQERL
jgi:NAD(P)-dependent dehydrogenase (short-subunit alcohol dehydrogenase family)